MDVGALSPENDGMKFILPSTDVFTGRAMANLQKSKQGAVVVQALKPMVARGYIYLHTDKGKQFYIRSVSDMLRVKGILHHSTENKNIKAGNVESFNRTLLEVMSRLMEHHSSKRYIDVLDDNVDRYNNTPHSRQEGTPDEIGW